MHPIPSPTPMSQHIRSIAVDIVLTLITCGLYNIYVQYKQIQAINAMLLEQKYSFLQWALLTLVTCGLYHIYHEFRKSSDLARLLKEPGAPEPILMVLLTMFGLHIVADAIQQAQINRYYGSSRV